MALFSFAKKKESHDTGSQFNIPTDQVFSMRQQGLSNNQIIQNLQNQGFKPNQIFDAMNQADISGNMNQAYPSDPTVQNPYAYPQQYAEDDQMQMPPENMQNMPPPPQPDIAQPQEQESIKERVEEIAEAIIDEKWNDLLKDINRVIEWKEKSESRLVKIEQEIKGLRENFDVLHKGVLGKISDYDSSINNVGVEIKAMEKVFQKILPSLTENVNRLSMLTKSASDAPPQMRKMK